MKRRMSLGGQKAPHSHTHFPNNATCTTRIKTNTNTNTTQKYHHYNMTDVGDMGSSSVVAVVIVVLIIEDDDVGGRWNKTPKSGHIARSILVAPSTFLRSLSKCPNVARRTRISYSSRGVVVVVVVVVDNRPPSDDDLSDPFEAAAAASSRRLSRLSIAYSIDAYDTTLGLYTRQRAGTDTDSSARYLAQSYTYIDGPS